MRCRSIRFEGLKGRCIVKNSYARTLIDEGMERFNLERIQSLPTRKAILLATSPYLAIRHALRSSKKKPSSGYIEIESPEQPKEILDYTEMFITSYCSLHCRWCSASIPYYEHKYHIDKDLLHAQTMSYLEAIDGVERFRLLGGEPFLHPDLAFIMRPLVESDKVQKVCLVTSGTVIPKDPEVLELLKNPKVLVDVSNYGAVNNRLDEILEMERQGLCHVAVDTVDQWFVPNHVYDDKGLTDEQVAERYHTCGDYCHVIRDGKLFYCGEAFHIANIPDSPVIPSDYVDLMDPTLSIEERRRQINDLIFKRNPTMHACSRCVGSFVQKDRFLVAGEQSQPGEPAPYDIPADIPLVAAKGI